MPADDYPARYRAWVSDHVDSGLAYGRLCVAKDHFLEEAIITAAREIAPPAGGIPAVQPLAIDSLSRTVFRGSVGSDYGKHLRWTAERDWQDAIMPHFATRNDLMNHSVANYLSFADERTDILNEYFLPTAQLPPFLARLREIIPHHSCDLLNATIREVCADPDTVLRYADQDMLAVVLFFTMERTPDADQAMAAFTRELVDATLALGGRHYLPYRLHATAEQFARAYPQAAGFFAAKRHWDPDELFQNGFYSRYAKGR